MDGVRLRDSVSGAERHVAVDGVFIAIGHTPTTAMFQGQVDLDEDGYVLTQPGTTRTSVPGVFAAGDVTTVPFKQIIIATGDGAKAALGAFDHLIRSSAPAPAAQAVAA